MAIGGNSLSFKQVTYHFKIEDGLCSEKGYIRS